MHFPAVIYLLPFLTAPRAQTLCFCHKEAHQRQQLTYSVFDGSILTRHMLALFTPFSDHHLQGECR